MFHNPHGPSSTTAAAGQVAMVVCRAAAGDEPAWEELVRRFEGLLRSIARDFRLSTEEGDDVAQTTWLRLLQNMSNLREPASVGGWLSSAMRHECIRVVRQRGRECLTDHWVDDEFVGDGIDADLLLAERNRLLWQAIDALPARQRQILYALSATPTPSYSQVSAALSIAVGTIGPTRAKALRRLREMLTASGAIDDALHLAC